MTWRKKALPWKPLAVTLCHNPVCLISAVSFYVICLNCSLHLVSPVIERYSLKRRKSGLIFKCCLDCVTSVSSLWLLIRGKGGGRGEGGREGWCMWHPPSVPGWWFKSVYLCPHRRLRLWGWPWCITFGSVPRLSPGRHRGGGLDFIQWAFFSLAILIKFRMRRRFGESGGGKWQWKLRCKAPSEDAKSSSWFIIHVIKCSYKCKAHILADRLGSWIFY